MSASATTTRSCPRCRGEGFVHSYKPPVPCPICLGGSRRSDCGACDGTGVSMRLCPACRGMRSIRCTPEERLANAWPEQRHVQPIDEWDEPVKLNSDQLFWWSMAAIGFALLVFLAYLPVLLAVLATGWEGLRDWAFYLRGGMLICVLIPSSFLIFHFIREVRWSLPIRSNLHYVWQLVVGVSAFLLVLCVLGPASHEQLNQTWDTLRDRVMGYDNQGAIPTLKFGFVMVCMTVIVALVAYELRRFYRKFA